jgi:serine/threonine protein kinase
LLLQQLAYFLRRIHLLGIYHGDMKATNILVSESGGRLSFCITDFDHIKPMRALRARQVLRNLYQLNKSFLNLAEVSLLDRYLFLKYYLGPYKLKELGVTWKKLRKITSREFKLHRRKFTRTP